MFVLPGLVFIPWLMLLFAQATNFDATWLTMCASRLLDGQTMVSSCYENNLPLSVIIYMIPALLERHVGWPVTETLPVYDLVLLGLSCAGLDLVIRKQFDLSQAQRHVLLFAYIAANTFPAGIWFGERDQLILFGLLPMCLAQIGVTQGRDLQGIIKWPVLVAGSIAVLIKPHYLVIPAAIGFHRLIKKKNIKFPRDLDFAVIAGMAVAYAALLFFFFGDYLNIILPDNINLYARLSDPHGSIWLLPLAVLSAIALSLQDTDPRDKLLADDVPTILLVLAALLVIPFLLQNKGIYYHLIPAMVLTICGASPKIMPKIADSTGLRTCWLVAAGCLVAVLPSLGFAHHDDFREWIITREANAGAPHCSFFMAGPMYDTQNVAHYSGCTYASRFPHLLALVWLEYEGRQEEQGLNRIPAARIAEYERRYARMITDDFQRYRPDTVILYQKNLFDGPFDLPRFLSANAPDFIPLWNEYKLVKTVRTHTPRRALSPIPDEDVYLIYRRRASTQPVQ